MKLHTDNERFSTLINFTSEHFQISQTFIEKDYWITRVLQRMAQNPNAEKVVSKGLCKALHKPLWTSLSATYQSELTPLAFSEIPDEKLVADSFIEIMEKII